MTTDPFYKQPPQREPDGENEGAGEAQSENAGTLRTLKDDVEQMVENDHISTAEIALAEQERRRKEELQEQPLKKSRTLTKISISVVLIVLGVAIVLLSFKYNLVPQGVKDLVGMDSEKENIIAKESAVKISTDNKNSLDIKREISEKIQSIDEEYNQIVEFELLKTQTVTEEETTKEIEVNINTEDFFRILESTSDDRLKRSMEKDFILGVYTDFENIPFLILRTSDINLSFAEMYKWEDKMYYELATVLNLKSEVPEFIEVDMTSSYMATSTIATTSPAVATNTIATNTNVVGTTTVATATTSTSTLPIQKIKNLEPQFSPKKFEDIVLLNRDIRAIIDEAGEIILMYSFVDNENIVLTKDRRVFEELVQRITSKKLVR